MRATNETDSLDELIIATEQQRAQELTLLKEGFHEVYESIKPLNFIKKVFHDVATSPDLKTDIVGNAIAIGTGLLSKKLVSGSTQSPFKKILGTVAGFAMTNLVSKNSGDIALVGNHLLKRFISNLTGKKEEVGSESNQKNDNST